MADRILVAYDGSAPADDAIEYAFETFPDASVTALYVVPEYEGYWSTFAEGTHRDIERARERGAEILEAATQLAAQYDRELETDVDVGKPHRTIVDRATEGGYETIVVGSHGREGVSRVLLGSVAEIVVRRSPIPVVVVR